MTNERKNVLEYLFMIEIAAIIPLLFFERAAIVVFVLGVAVILATKSRQEDKIVAISFLEFLMYAVHLRICNFVFIPQAYDLLKYSTSLLFWFKQGHFHAIRLLIAYPAYVLSEICNIELNLAFSYYCTIVFSLIYVFVAKIVSQHAENYDIRISYCQFLIIFMLSTIMNGRICFAYLGFIILIEEMSSYYNNENLSRWVVRYIKVVIGIVLSTVSSGTMVVCIAYTVAVFILRIIKNKTISRGALRLFVVLAISSPVLIVGGGYVIAMINKNIVYFGSIINMLQHGLGKVFGQISGKMVVLFVLLAIAGVIINIFVLVYCYKNFNVYLPLIIGINLSMYGLLVGFSTGSMIIIPGISISLIILSRFCEGEQLGWKNRKAF